MKTVNQTLVAHSGGQGFHQHRPAVKENACGRTAVNTGMLLADGSSSGVQVHMLEVAASTLEGAF